MGRMHRMHQMGESGLWGHIIRWPTLSLPWANSSTSGTLQTVNIIAATVHQEPRCCGLLDIMYWVSTATNTLRYEAKSDFKCYCAESAPFVCSYLLWCSFKPKVRAPTCRGGSGAVLQTAHASKLDGCHSTRSWDAEGKTSFESHTMIHHCYFFFPTFNLANPGNSFPAGRWRGHQPEGDATVAVVALQGNKNNGGWQVGLLKKM